MEQLCHDGVAYVPSASILTGGVAHLGVPEVAPQVLMESTQKE